jgi:hypothetical protein
MRARAIGERGDRRVMRVLLGLVLGLLLLPAAARATITPVRAGAGSRPAAVAAGRAAGYLRRAQNADGGFGAAPGERSAALFSGWAALGLASEGVDIASLRRGPGDRTLLQYLRVAARATDSGSLERSILALHAAGAPLTDSAGRNLVRVLVRRFSRRGAVSGLVNLTAFGLLALCAAHERGTTALESRAAGWLAREANRDGGYGFAGRGSQSDADDTGAALQALHCAPRRSAPALTRARRRAVGRAVSYLRRHQDRDGGFAAAPGAGSNAQSTAWAIQGLRAAGVDPARLRRGRHTPLGYLAGLVSRGGRVAYARGQIVTPVWVTGEALLGLTGRPLPLR